jgi:hypothetical protein
MIAARGTQFSINQNARELSGQGYPRTQADAADQAVQLMQLNPSDLLPRPNPKLNFNLPVVERLFFDDN